MVGPNPAAVINTVVTAPLTEELVKASVMLLLFYRAREHFGVTWGLSLVGISAFTFALFERTAFSLQGNADGVIVFWDRQYYISTVMTGLSHGVMTGFTALACAWLLLGNNRPRLPAFRGWACLRRSPRTPSTIQPLPSTGLATIPSFLRPLCTR